MPSGQLETMKKEIIIDGNNFDSLDKFYNEIENKMTKGLDWKIGRNLDAYNDILRGGFGVHDYEEPIKIKWINSGQSKKNLGQEETIKYLEEKIKRCHPTNTPSVQQDLENAKRGQGQTLFEFIIEITRGQKHIQLSVE
jgi:RNAse (barnase) inhibitor barstar